MRKSLLLAACVIACGPARRAEDGGVGDTNGCAPTCSDDLRTVVACDGIVLTTCGVDEACDKTRSTCRDACFAAEANLHSVGCDYYATQMDSFTNSSCFAMIVANTWPTPAHISIEYKGQAIQVDAFARIPHGGGASLTLDPYDQTAGLPPGEVAILFLAGLPGLDASCPIAPAQPSTQVGGTRIQDAFHVTTDVPVTAYQINPYGGASAAVTAASLLLPTGAWDTNYVAVNASAATVPGKPSMNIIARDDNTEVTFRPSAVLAPGIGVPGSAADEPITITLAKGEHLQLTQSAELTGSSVTATKPVGFMAGHVCMQMPIGTDYCDHAEQMIPPARALGSRYVGVMYRPRVAIETSTYWRIVGAVDGTLLTYSSDVGGPATINKGQQVFFETGTPFAVQSQDADHPFMLFTYMTSSLAVGDGYGDPDFVTSVPPDQYLKQYVFFADPTYPETNLVVVRSRDTSGEYKDVVLDCAGALTGWQPIDGDHEYTRRDLTTGDFEPVGGCSTGRHEIRSDAPFGLWVWGWGTPTTMTYSKYVSYGYPGGMNVAPINAVIF